MSISHGQKAEMDDVLGAIGSASLLLQPSAREGQSRVVAEAMALGTPVLAAEGPETAVADFLSGGPHGDACLLPIDAARRPGRSESSN